MKPSDIINPTQVDATPKRDGFWKQFGVLILGTTVSIILTLGTAQLVEKRQRAKDRSISKVQRRAA